MYKMQNPEKLICIQDNIEGKSYVYTNDLNENGDFIKCYEFLCNNYKIKYGNTIPLEISITEEHCKIFCDDTVVTNGWVWNTTKKQIKVLYELTKIPILIPKYNRCDTISHFTQTFIQTDTHDTQTTYNGTQSAVTQTTYDGTQSAVASQVTQTENEELPSYGNVFIQTSASQVTQNEERTVLDKLYNLHNPNFFTDIFLNGELKLNNSTELDTCFQSDQAFSSEINENFNFGYAYNPFNPINNKIQRKTSVKRSSVLFPRPNYDALNKELKEVLSKPNLGLKIRLCKKND